MKNAEMTKDIAYQTGTTLLGTKGFLNALANTVREALLGDDSEIAIEGIGKFSVVATEARKGRNPHTGEQIDIPAGFRIKFKAAAALRDGVNRPIVGRRFQGIPDSEGQRHNLTQ